MDSATPPLHQCQRRRRTPGGWALGGQSQPGEWAETPSVRRVSSSHQFLNEILTRSSPCILLPVLRRAGCGRVVLLPLSPQSALSGAFPPSAPAPSGQCAIAWLGRQEVDSVLEVFVPGGLPYQLLCQSSIPGLPSNRSSIPPLP